MSRKVKFSNNWKNAKGRVQKRQARIANARRDYLHKASATISQNHALVVLEDLQVGNMSRSARGSVEQPGRHIRQKSGLNRAVLDQGWYAGKTHEKPLYDGLRSALPVGANVVI